MAKKDVPDEIQQIIDSSREEFDLDAVVRGRSVRTKKQKVFTDEVTGEQLGGHEIITTRNALGVEAREIRSWGLYKQILDLSGSAEAEKKNAKQIKALKEEVKVLAEKLDETSLVFELQSIPPLIKKDARRAARKALNINGKLTDGDPRFEDYLDEHDAQVLTRVVVSVTQTSTGKTNKGISIERARTLKSHLPETEWHKLERAINELLWQGVIAEKAVEDADF